MIQLSCDNYGRKIEKPTYKNKINAAHQESLYCKECAYKEELFRKWRRTRLVELREQFNREKKQRRKELVEVNSRL